MNAIHEFQRLLQRAVAKYERLSDTETHTHSVHDLSRQYGNAFKAFQELWTCLQSNRRVLVEAGLKRSDIGQIAAKIGHLHFNWYLRCADTRFLVESYVFYEAIHARQYYQDLLQDSSMLMYCPPGPAAPAPAPAGAAAAQPQATAAAAASGPGNASQGTGQQQQQQQEQVRVDCSGLSWSGVPVAEQQLRYYARFILVCILLGNKEEAVNLLQEFHALVAAYTMMMGNPPTMGGAAGKELNSSTGTPQHHGEWQLVLAEVVGLLTSDPGMPLPRSPGAALSFRPCCRACPSSVEATCAAHTPRIHHAVLVGYHHKQVKLAELPVDVVRMMQALEWHDARVAASEGLNMMSDPQHTTPQHTDRGGAEQQAAHASGVAPDQDQQDRDSEGQASTSYPTLLLGDGCGCRGSTGHQAPLSTIPERASPGGGATHATIPSAPGPASADMTSRGGSSAGHSSSTLLATALQQQQQQAQAAGAGSQPAGGSAFAATGQPPAAAVAAAAPGPATSQLSAPPQQQQQQQQQQEAGYINPPRTLLYRTTAPALLCALHGAAATLPLDARRVLLLYLSAGSLRTRLQAAAAHGSSGSNAHSNSQLHMQGGRLVPAPVARLPAVPSTSCLTSSLIAAAAAASTSASSLRDASGADLGSAWCLSPPPPPSTSATTTTSSSSTSSSSSGAGAGALACCALRVEELRPLTRHRLLVVADGDVACELRGLVGSELAYPLLALMSPRHRPSAFGDASRTGQLFTLFLTLPVSAFCLIMGEQDPPPHTLRALQDAVEESLGCIANTLQQGLTPPAGSTRQASLNPAPSHQLSGLGMHGPPPSAPASQPHPIAAAHASTHNLLGSPLVSLLAQAQGGPGGSGAGQAGPSAGNGSSASTAAMWMKQQSLLHSRSGSSVSDIAAAATGAAAPHQGQQPQQGGGVSPWSLPFQDGLLRQLMCRFVLGRAALSYHRASTGRPECQADCTPELPAQLSPSAPVCVEAVLRIAAVLRRQALFEGHVSVCAAAAAAAPVPSHSQALPTSFNSQDAALGPASLGLGAAE